MKSPEKLRSTQDDDDVFGGWKLISGDDFARRKTEYRYKIDLKLFKAEQELFNLDKTKGRRGVPWHQNMDDVMFYL